MPAPLRILVVTRSYPAAGNLYQYPFVHRRVLAYLAEGHHVAVFRPDTAHAGSYEHEGVTCIEGWRGQLDRVRNDFRPDVLAVHGLSEQLTPVLEGILGAVPICAWLHGSEIPEFARRKGMLMAGSQRETALSLVEDRCAFWREFLGRWPERFRLVFPSFAAVAMAREDLGQALVGDRLSVIPNPIDTDLFSYSRKADELRLAILMIRPFDSASYGNDLAVRAIELLKGREQFERLRFTLVGDGSLHDETVGPVRSLPNVTIEQRFLVQEEIAALHRSHGIFLVPTRLDTQGVSRDEAMASGLVPVTNRVAAVPEFVDESCGMLAGPEDSPGLAEGLWRLVQDSALFEQLSAAAAQRVRRQTGHKLIIPQELNLLHEAASW